MSSDEQSDKECPLCMEPLEIDDINFYPCKCEYQICRFCWHRLRTDENGLCPACRQPYPEDPVNFKPLTASDVQKMKTEKRQKQQQQKIKICESRKHLSSYRVLQKNLVYVVGLSARVADPETLKKPEYFGKYGRILKVAVGSSPSSNGPQSASCTAYVTYARYEDALRAIQAVNNAQLDGRIVKASLGTTKYCTNFLRSQPCHKPECMYLHDVADTEVSFTKDDMHLGRHAEYEKRLIESTLKEKSQRGRTSVVTANTGRKPSKSKSTERGPDGRLSATANSNNQDGEEAKTAKSRSPSGDKVIKKAVNKTNGEISSKLCCVANNKLESENKGADKENEAQTPEKMLKTAESSSPVKCEQSISPLPPAKINNEVARGSRSRLAEWISHDQPIAPRSKPLLATTCSSIEKMFLNRKENMNTSNNTMVPPNGNGDGAGQLPNANISCDWQRALGISPKIDNSTTVTKNTVIETPASLCNSQPRILPRSTRLSVHSDDDLGFDPISESAKGLADLLEEEKTITPQYAPQNTGGGSGSGSGGMTSVSSSLMSLGMQCGWPSMGMSNGGGGAAAGGGRGSPLSLKNLFGTDAEIGAQTTNNFPCSNNDYFPPPMKFYPSRPGQTTYTQQPSSAFHNNQYAPHTYFTPNKSHMARVNSNFGNPPANMGSYNSVHQQQQQQRCPSYGGGNNTHYFSNMHQPPAATNHIDGSKLHEWQEGFRALLPNVNVRFVPDLGSAGYPPSRTSPMEMHRTNNHHQFPPALNMPMPAPLGNPMQAAAPPAINSYSPHPAQQWMMPPPGFSYVSKR